MLSALAATLLSCATPSDVAPTAADPETAPAAAKEPPVPTLRADDIDPDIYFDIDDPNDPHRRLYAEFRARRERDLADPNLPAPPGRYPAAHFTRQFGWSSLSRVLPGDWGALQREDAAGVAALEASMRVRLAFDHPDIKIVQWMLGPGAALPAHAGGSPGVWIVVGGRGEMTVEGVTQTATPGTTVKLNPYDVRRAVATGDEPLRWLWIRWAPDGDQAFIDAGYYLTGANQHVQPTEATMPADYAFWNARYETAPVASPASPAATAAEGSVFAEAAVQLEERRRALGPGRDPYPDVPRFRNESEVSWLTVETLRSGGFFFSRDIASLGPVVTRMAEITKHKAIFRATRADGRWDFNISQTAWGPRSTYVEHSHLVPEFYYILSGPVIYGVDGERYRVQPGDILFNNPYSPHLAQGIVNDLPFDNFGSTWAPNGDRSVFTRPFFWVEPLPEQPPTSRLARDVAFH